MAAESCARYDLDKITRYYEVTNGPPRWDVMLALFDRRLEDPYPSNTFSFSGRMVSFSYRKSDGKIGQILISIFSATRHMDENSELLDEVWTIEGYIFHSRARVKITDYSFEKRSGLLFADCL
jgi:hypothetical protein